MSHGEDLAPVAGYWDVCLRRARACFLAAAGLLGTSLPSVERGVFVFLLHQCLELALSAIVRHAGTKRRTSSRKKGRPAVKPHSIKALLARAVALRPAVAELAPGGEDGARLMALIDRSYIEGRYGRLVVAEEDAAALLSLAHVFLDGAAEICAGPAVSKSPTATSEDALEEARAA